MLARAKAKLEGAKDVTFEEGDFLASNPPSGNELVIAIRCFEYFEDKPGALKKMRALLKRDGRLVIITKNPRMITSRPAQSKQLHSDQVSRERMQRIASEAGFTLEHAYPAVLRMKATLLPLRIAFDLLHRLSVICRMELPLATYATESYVYEFRTS
jgi:ubiquinone/menaquinone biosynthesis C-methylase UbiE